MFGRNSSENLLKKIVELDTVEFLGICKILGVKLYDDALKEDVGSEEKIDIEPRKFEDIWGDLCDEVEKLNRTRRRNLNKLVSAAIKKGD